jgi:hypothetical protein
MGSAHERSLLLYGFDESHDNRRVSSIGFCFSFISNHRRSSFSSVSMEPRLLWRGIVLAWGVHKDGKGQGPEKTGAWDKDPAFPLFYFYFILIILRSTTTPDDTREQQWVLSDI